jgi:hypothetical protein
MTCLRRLLPWATIAFLSFLVVLSLSAGLTGADPDMRWGLLRRAVFVFGAAGLLGAACLQLIRVLDRRAISRSHAPDDAKPEVEIRSPSSHAKAVSIGPLAPLPARPNRRWIAQVTVALTVMIIGITYVGLVSVWHWTEWPATTAGYAVLGDAFGQGKTYLANDSVFCDINAPYYKGRCYLYQGPAPAVALAMLKMLGGPPLGDEVVVFAAVSLIFLFSSLIIFRLKLLYFERLPLWLLIAGLVTVATIHPMLWFQNSPEITAAAIASGQAFLVGGVYFMVRAVTDAKAAPAHYAVAGALWALAMASRLTTAPPVIVLALGAAVLSLRQAGRMHARKAEAVNLISLLAPLVLVLGLYGWYNLIRFDNPLETGWRYAPYNVARFGSPSETGWGHLFSAIESNDRMTGGTPFSLRYLVPNTFYHLFAPIRPISSFPYLRALYGDYPPFSQVRPRLGVPAVSDVEDAAGLVFAAPTLLFIVTFARKWLYGEIPRQSRSDSPVTKAVSWTPIDQGALGLLLLLSGIAGLLPAILNYFSTIRYELDFVPLLAVVAVLGMWRFHEDTRPFPIQSRLATSAIILIVTAATLVSFLLALSGAGSRFDDANPSLFSFLVGYLPHW